MITRISHDLSCLDVSMKGVPIEVAWKTTGTT